MKKNHIDLITLGCSKNLVDTEKLMYQLRLAGYTVSHDAEKPNGEIIVINTCGFIGDAKEESINMILSFAEKKQKRQLKKLFVMGCLSQRYLQELSVEIPEVDKFYGKFNYNELLKELGKEYRSDCSVQRDITTPMHYSYVKISEGCNRACSYCAIPIITGRYQSREIEDIEEEVKWLVTQGVKEFQLIAQDLSYYGLDNYKELKLAELTERIADIEGVEWLRLHYLYPTSFPIDVLKVMRERDNVCKYLDIALQHISDPMLKKMRRGITSEQTYELLRMIREQVPGIHIRTTMLLGHPGETEEDVEALKKFIQEMRFERLGAFAYSDEEDTYSNKHYTDDIPFEVKQQRVDEIMEIQQTISLEHNEAKIGKQYKIIIDSLQGDYYVARTEYDSPEVDMEVLIKKEESELVIGNFYTAQVIAAEEFDLYAHIIK
ncbi:MAG: 30S ribosomal protein S12 methylthiotransferase RimO [Paludibacteraceae bacterium]|nr:30S ribosomal protein S12 methylthiotransferase RimO [Paludibacteraceae bacterium]MBP6285049.1 30S ribosomal protein S12 methylthiotransferase RimO [Paludibacteraceae bacterium]